MPDETDPSQPPPPQSPPTPTPGPETSTTSPSTGLPSNVAAAIACIPLIGGIIFYILEKRDNFVRFYAMQSIIFGCAWLLFNIVSTIVHAVFGAIPGIGGVLVFFWAIVAALVHIAFLVIWIIATVKAFTGVRWDIPYVGPMARKQVEGAG
jgi:uncharacterized membrane protein